MFLRLLAVTAPVACVALVPATAMAQGGSTSSPSSPSASSSSATDDSSPTDADAITARARYDAGTRAFADRRFVEAALDFEAAAARKASAVALFTAGLAWERANLLDRAADNYARALGTPGLPQDKSSQATDRLAALEAILGTVHVGGPAQSTASTFLPSTVLVQIDGNTAQALPASLHGAGGVHTLTIIRPGAVPERTSVVLTAGSTVHVDVTPPSVPPPASPSGGSAHGVEARRSVGLVALGAAGAALLAGVALGLETLDARDAYDSAPSRAAYDHANGLRDWTNAAFVTGGALLAGGLVLELWPSSSPASAATDATPATPAAPSVTGVHGTGAGDVRIRAGVGRVSVEEAF